MYITTGLVRSKAFMADVNGITCSNNNRNIKKGLIIFLFALVIKFADMILLYKRTRRKDNNTKF